MATRILPKGGNIALADLLPAGQVTVALGWDDRPELADLELDAVIIVTRTNPPAPTHDGNIHDDNGGHELLLAQQVPNPDERPTATPPPRPLTGDAERLLVRLGAVPSDIERLHFGVAVYDAPTRPPTFRSVHGAYLRLLAADGTELVRCRVAAETGLETTMIFGELYRHAHGWKLRCVAQGYTGGLTTLATGTTAAHPMDVTAFLTRTSPARSRRTIATHLHPHLHPQPRSQPPVRPESPPAPSAPRPAPRPAGPAPSHAAPAPTPTRRSTLDLGGDDRPTPAQPAPSEVRSALDLGGPAATHPTHQQSSADQQSSAQQAAAGPQPAGALARGCAEPGRPGGERRVDREGGPVASTVRVGAHSSRHRQRTEQVDTLDDDHPATIWTAANRGTGAMTITLRWSTLTTRTGLPRPSNIHLGCLWQAGPAPAASGVLQELDGLVSAPGRGARRQVLRLGRRDERDGQTLFVDLASLPTFRRFFVYAYGLRGVPPWAELRAELDVRAASGEQLTVRLGAAPSDAPLCVVASFHVVEDDLVIRRENDFLPRTQADAAARYGWALDWAPGGTTLRTGR
ncbi:TerD family protein [Frankia sp. R82]|uniref:TerD family protein n=1 Tax=Frankia sp. R82 TaxID=2950553 RepID=UPI0020447750|nr:TerD family protein [Frankia sp. R82]MCM3884390.1 TerD domain-containing protein [Frankia sp. R82]